MRETIRRTVLAALVVTLIGGYLGPTKAASSEKGPPEERAYKDCKIVFVQASGWEEMDAEIYSMNADGSEKKNLTNTPDQAEQAPAWTPDGKKIVFTSIAVPSLPNGPKMPSIPLETLWQAKRSAQIYVMNADGSEKKKLADNSARSGLPLWSPDGSKIVFSSYKDDKYGFCVMNADGSDQKYFTETGSYCCSPDGKKLAFASYRDGNMEIYVMNADGSGQQRLTNNPARDDFPAWSPDGQKIIFTSDRDKIQLQQREGQVFGYAAQDGQVTALKGAKAVGVWEIYIMNVDGSEQRRLTKTESIEDMASMYSAPPTWSPDGKKIMFMPDIVSTDPRMVPNPQIHVINADGSGRKRLARDCMSASWSPDGRKVVFTSRITDIRHLNLDICIMNPDGTDQRNLTNSPTWESQPKWSPFLQSSD